MANQINTNLSSGGFSFDNLNYGHSNEYNSGVSSSSGMNITETNYTKTKPNEINTGLVETSNSNEVNGSVDTALNEAHIFDDPEAAGQTGATASTSQPTESQTESTSETGTKPESKKEEQKEEKKDKKEEEKKPEPTPANKNGAYKGYDINNYPTTSVYQGKKGEEAAFDRAVIAANYIYQNSDLTKEQAAALAGVMLDENGVQPKAVCSVDQGAGIYSWTYSDYKNQCLKNMGYPAGTPIESLSFKEQCDLIIAMSNGSEKYYFNGLRRCDNVQDASYTAIVMIGGTHMTPRITNSWKGSHPDRQDALAIQSHYYNVNKNRVDDITYCTEMVDRRSRYAREILAEM